MWGMQSSKFEKFYRVVCHFLSGRGTKYTNLLLLGVTWQVPDHYYWTPETLLIKAKPLIVYEVLVISLIHLCLTLASRVLSTSCSPGMIK